MADDKTNSANSSILSIRSLEKSFGSLSVLKDISLSVERGNVVSIIGPSGSGKSTLLRCASFLEHADGGDILYDGQYALKNGVYASKAELNRFRTRFGLVFQNFQLFPHYSVLRNIAEKTGLDISTISRVVSSKYVQTHFGIYSLKFFFSEGLVANDGEEVSTREIKTILTTSIEEEDKRKPLTDEELVKVLCDKGYKVARRTVAKYREQLNIPIARLRKEL